MAAQEEIDLRRLYWVGPATVGAAVMAVMVCQKIAVALVPPVSQFSESILKSDEPALVTAVLVTGAVIIFPMFVEMASNPLRTFRRMSLAVMLISCAPNLFAALSRDAGVEWGMLALMVMHVVAWAVTVPMLTRLAVTTARAQENETPTRD
jgi:hypothetical protein